MHKTTLERFEEKYIAEPNTGCWLWIAGLTHQGYGKFRWNGDNDRQAHRYSYIQHREPIPPGLVPDHLCRVRSCVNPWHLELVTDRENILRGVGPPALNARKSMCQMGHPLEGENLRLLGNRRRCRICCRVKNRERYWANPELRRQQALESYYRCRSITLARSQ
jgi:hypothetical protein